MKNTEKTNQKEKKKPTEFGLLSNIKLPDKVKKELEKDYEHLVTITKKPKEFHIKEALVEYLEKMEDFFAIHEHIKNKGQNTKYYTSEELEKKLG